MAASPAVAASPAAVTDSAAFAGQSVAMPATTDPGIARRQLEQLPVDQIEQYWNDLLAQYGGYFPDRQPPTLADMLIGGGGFSLADTLRGMIRFLFHEILYNGKLLVTIVVITVFGMLLETFQSAFERTSVSKVAYAVSYIVLLIVAVNSFHVAIGYAKSAIDSMVHFMIAMVPLLLTLLASMGNVVTVTIMHPLIVFMIHAVGTLIYTIVFPLLFFSAVLHLVSSLTDKYKVTQLANLLRTISVGLLGLVLAIFLGVISVQGATSAAMDGVTLRTAKYIAGNFVPIVGRMLADATDTVLTASLLVKNAIGLMGVIIIVMLCAFPAIKIITLALIYNLAAAVLQPLGNNPIIACLQTIGKSLIFVFAAVASVGLMFFLAITIMITAGNITVMLR